MIEIVITDDAVQDITVADSPPEISVTVQNPSSSVEIEVSQVGTQGPPGESVYNPRGEYVNDGSTQYYENDIVSWLGSSYLCLEEHHGATPPSPTYWQLLAAKGDAGAAGTNGTNGTDGVGVPNGGGTGQILAKQSNDDYDAAWINPPSDSGTAGRFALFDASTGLLSDLSNYGFDSNRFNGMDLGFAIEVTDGDNYTNLHNSYTQVDAPTGVNLARQNWNIRFDEAVMGANSEGRQLGDSTNGSLSMLSQSVRADQGSNIGSVSMFNAYFTVGNPNASPSPIEVHGNDYNVFGGNLQLGTGSSLRNARLFDIGYNGGGNFTGNFVGFNQYGNLTGEVEEGVSAFSTGINFGEVGYFNSFATFNHFDTVNGGGNVFADFTQIIDHADNWIVSFFAGPQLEDVEGYSGVQINPTVSARNSATGVDVNMQNANAPFVKAANFVGDVSINGDLSFTGALSLGRMNAFSSLPLQTGVTPGQPGLNHMLISSYTLADGQSVTSADQLGINTAMILQIGDGCDVATDFLGLSAMVLPAVVSIGNGSVVDHVVGGTFAISVDGSKSGGTAELVELCKSVAIPAAGTDIDRLYGYSFDMLGPISGDIWGLYMAPDCQNWIKGSLRIGGTSGSDDFTDSGVQFQLDGSARFDGDIGFFSTAPVSQQTGGASTAGGTYTSTEQAMIQTMWDALRAYGLLS